MYLFADRLRQAVEAKGVTQKWLADASHTTEATISRYINEKKRPSVLTVIVDISKALGVSTDYLLGVTNIPFPKDSLSSASKLLLDAFDRSSEKDRGVIWHILDDYLTPQEKDYLLQSAQSLKNDAG